MALGKGEIVKIVQDRDLRELLSNFDEIVSYDQKRLCELIYTLYGCKDLTGTLNQLRHKLRA